MKNFKIIKNSMIIFAIFFTMIFCSCDSEITITKKNDETLEITFFSKIGTDLQQMLVAATGTEGEFSFDTQTIQYELAKNGFSDVKVFQTNQSELNIKMNENSKKSILYTSKIISDSPFTITLDSKKLLDFYNSSDSEIQSFLDLLLSPVFNNETMTQTEYIETISAFYGENAANEISKSTVKIKITDEKTTESTIPLSKLLTLTETIILK